MKDAKTGPAEGRSEEGRVGPDQSSEDEIERTRPCCGTIGYQ
jgi:hypothetical protein